MGMESTTKNPIVRRSLELGVGSDLDLKFRSPTGRDAFEKEMPEIFEKIVSGTEIVWLYGFGENYNSKENYVWCELNELNFLDDKPFGLISFLTNNLKYTGNSLIVFQQGECEGEHHISLLSGNRRMLYELNKWNGSVVARLQVKEESWIDVGLLVGEEAYISLYEIVRESEIISKNLNRGAGSPHINSTPGSVG